MRTQLKSEYVPKGGKKQTWIIKTITCYGARHNSTQLGWWRGLAVTRWSRSTKLLYARPG